METEEYLAEVTAAINDGRVHKLKFNSDGSGVEVYFYTSTGEELVSSRMETFIEYFKGKEFYIKETNRCF
jgi:hypothetical protein